ncbi:uncharacterized protein G2W53_010180 [Senna tora]|uniref:Uncharacterized protein n=1 Tax=Senna tora TaxID=362788 RepID=A0A835CB24_9FABA|nr:uncharacterized protein G2W53_010178 [Senna tora]KAF7835321.1 uncharacterized protein G2W53_010180 [Senna tora]
MEELNLPPPTQPRGIDAESPIP